MLTLPFFIQKFRCDARSKSGLLENSVLTGRQATGRQVESRNRQVAGHRSPGGGGKKVNVCSKKM
jgi:hypothetical protein